jgi:hypothetical protein
VDEFKVVVAAVGVEGALKVLTDAPAAIPDRKLERFGGFADLAAEDWWDCCWLWCKDPL